MLFGAAKYLLSHNLWRHLQSYSVWALEAFNFHLPCRSGITLINVIYAAVNKVPCRWNFRLQQGILRCLLDFKGEGEWTPLLLTLLLGIFRTIKSMEKLFLFALPKINAALRNGFRLITAGNAGLVCSRTCSHLTVGNCRNLFSTGSELRGEEARCVCIWDLEMTCFLLLCWIFLKFPNFEKEKMSRNYKVLPADTKADSMD